MAIDPTSMAMLEMHALNGAQRTADGASNGAEAMRLDYLEGKRKMDIRESTALQEARASTIAREVKQAKVANSA